MHIDLPLTWYGTKESLDFFLDTDNSDEFQVFVTTQNIFQRLYTYITGNECSTTEKVSNVADLLKEVHFPEDLNTRIHTYSRLNEKFRVISYEFFEGIFTDKDFDINYNYADESSDIQPEKNFSPQVDEAHDAGSSEEDILDGDQKHSTLWGFVSDVPKANGAQENKYDEVKLETIRENVSKLIKLVLNNEKLIIELEGTRSPDEIAQIELDKIELDGNDSPEEGIVPQETSELEGLFKEDPTSKIYPSEDRVSLGRNLLNLHKDSLKNLNKEQLTEKITENTEEAINTIISFINNNGLKLTDEEFLLLKTIHKDCLDSGLIEETSSEEVSAELPVEVVYDTTKLITLLDCAFKYIDQAVKDMEKTNFADTDEFVGRLKNSKNYLANVNSPKNLQYFVNNAYEDVAFFYVHNNLKISKELADLTTILKKNVHETGFPDLRSVDL